MPAVSDKQALKRIATNMRRLRAEHGLSLRALAREIDDYPTSVKRIEDGESMPGAGLLTRISEALGVTVNELLADPKEMSNAS